MKQYCAGCKNWHEPDVLCGDVTGQMLRDIDVRPRKGGGTGQLSGRTILLMLLGFVAVLLLGGILSFL